MIRITTTPAMVALILGAMTTLSSATAQTPTRAQQCDAYARQAAASTPNTTGVARGAARGAVGAAIVGGDPGRGAVVGAAVGGVRGAAQENRSYEWYYNDCMSR